MKKDLIKEFEPRQAYDEGKKDGKPAIFASSEIIIPTFMVVFKPQEKEDSISCGINGKWEVNLLATKTILERIKPEDFGYVHVFERKDFKLRSHHEWICYEKIKPVHVVKVFRRDIPVEIKEKE